MGSANVLSKDHPSQKRETTLAFPTWKSAGALDELLVDRPIKKVIEPQDQEKQSPLDKTPSNVRKMVLAFETNPVKLTDSDLAPNINEKTSGQRKSLDSGSSSSNNGNSRRPIGQALKIAIMVGFGILVFLNRQRR